MYNDHSISSTTGFAENGVVSNHALHRQRVDLQMRYLELSEKLFKVGKTIPPVNHSLQESRHNSNSLRMNIMK